MYPSFMVTREEKDSTRGRARLLFEMLQGDPLKEGWRSGAVRGALDLCLACKGDCPVNVDMATYKAEFLSHYYKGRLRPLTAYSIGLIHWWVRPASLMPGLVNFFTQTPVLRDIVKLLGGFACLPRQLLHLLAIALRQIDLWNHDSPRKSGRPISHLLLSAKPSPKRRRKLPRCRIVATRGYGVCDGSCASTKTRAKNHLQTRRGQSARMQGRSIRRK